jgi:hypothetical protein
MIRLIAVILIITFLMKAIVATAIVATNGIVFAGLVYLAKKKDIWDRAKVPIIIFSISSGCSCIVAILWAVGIIK